MNRPHAQRGFTLVEAVVSASLLMFVGMGAVMLTSVSRDGAAMTRSQASQTNWLRRASMAVREDLAQTTASRLTIATLTDQNHSITFQRPTACTAGVTTWGAYDGSAAEGERMRDDHFTRFTVRAGSNGRQLVRQVLDSTMALVHEDVLAYGLASGSATPPGLRIVASGNLWQVTIGLAATSTQRGASLTFDVALHN